MELFGTFLLVGSVLLGAGMVSFLEKANKRNIIKLLLTLSGGFLLALSFTHLIPEIYHSSSKNIIGYFVLLGFIVQLVLEYFSKGIEHGHIHTHDHNIKQNLPWALFIALSIHSILEGMPLQSDLHLVGQESTLTHVHSHEHAQDFGKSGLLLGVVLHKIPVAIALMTLFLSSKMSIKKSWILILIFSLMAPLGTMLGHFGSKIIIINFDILLAIVVGMFLHISTTIIFESTVNHKFNFLKLVSLFIGIALALIGVNF